MIKELIAAFVGGMTGASSAKNNKDNEELKELNKKVKQKEKEYRDACEDFNESLMDMPGKTMKQKYKAYTDALSTIKFDKPIPIITKK